MKEKCPCKNCICISVCRLKSYNDLVEDCTLLVRYYDEITYETNPSDYPVLTEKIRNSIILLEKILNPVTWEVNLDESDKFSELIVRNGRKRSEL